MCAISLQSIDKLNNYNDLEDYGHGVVFSRALSSIQQQMALLRVLEIIGGNGNVSIEKLSTWIGQGFTLVQAMELLDSPVRVPQKYLQTILNLSNVRAIHELPLLQLAKQLDADGQSRAALAVCALLNGEAGLINAPTFIRDQAVQLKNAILSQGKFTGLNIYRSVRDVGHAAQEPYTIISLMVAGMAYRVVQTSIASLGLGEPALLAQAAKISGVVAGTNVEAGVFTVSQMLPEIIKGQPLNVMQSGSEELEQRHCRPRCRELCDLPSIRRTNNAFPNGRSFVPTQDDMIGITWQSFWAAYKQNLVMVASLKTGGAIFLKAAEAAHGVSSSTVISILSRDPLTVITKHGSLGRLGMTPYGVIRGLEFAKFNIVTAHQVGSFTGMLASNLYGNPNLSWAENFTQAAHATVAYGLAGKMGSVAVGNVIASNIMSSRGEAEGLDQHLWCRRCRELCDLPSAWKFLKEGSEFILSNAKDPAQHDIIRDHSNMIKLPNFLSPNFATVVAGEITSDIENLTTVPNHVSMAKGKSKEPRVVARTSFDLPEMMAFKRLLEKREQEYHIPTSFDSFIQGVQSILGPYDDATHDAYVSAIQFAARWVGRYHYYVHKTNALLTILKLVFSNANLLHFRELLEKVDGLLLDQYWPPDGVRKLLSMICKSVGYYAEANQEEYQIIFDTAEQLKKNEFGKWYTNLQATQHALDFVSFVLRNIGSYQRNNFNGLMKLVIKYERKRLAISGDALYVERLLGYIFSQIGAYSAANKRQYQQKMDLEIKLATMKLSATLSAALLAAIYVKEGPLDTEYIGVVVTGAKHLQVLGMSEADILEHMQVAMTYVRGNNPESLRSLINGIIHLR